eukprot:CAMPEP_0117674560 /NCGR_PEP_ID=MMETSP0804-20121206/15109_1 /TAXON_ID=1074897 /ORGANISM="Tetraselmis astigmatica, Strain CCMP880" /LENGTH=495 /DNA_ID=CAMNT_0005483449 /DNA_START=339 /DNA_END=1826 /DNA_ORIENTATION=-
MTTHQPLNSQQQQPTARCLSGAGVDVLSLPWGLMTSRVEENSGKSWMQSNEDFSQFQDHWFPNISTAPAEQQFDVRGDLRHSPFSSSCISAAPGEHLTSLYPPGSAFDPAGRNDSISSSLPMSLMFHSDSSCHSSPALQLDPSSTRHQPVANAVLAPEMLRSLPADSTPPPCFDTGCKEYDGGATAADLQTLLAAIPPVSNQQPDMYSSQPQASMGALQQQPLTDVQQHPLVDSYLLKAPGSSCAEYILPKEPAQLWPELYGQTGAMTSSLPVQPPSASYAKIETLGNSACNTSHSNLPSMQDQLADPSANSALSNAHLGGQKMASCASCNDMSLSLNYSNVRDSFKVEAPAAAATDSSGEPQLSSGADSDTFFQLQPGRAVVSPQKEVETDSYATGCNVAVRLEPRHSSSGDLMISANTDDGQDGQPPTRTRQQQLQRYREKKLKRFMQPPVRYKLRKANADQRPRIKGRFVKKHEEEAARNEAKRLEQEKLRR